MTRTRLRRVWLGPVAACSLLAWGATASPVAAAPAGASWGFFSYTKDFQSGLSNARWGRATAVLWTELERSPGSGVYTWTTLDSKVKLAQKAGVNVVLVLKVGNGASFSDPVCLQRVEAEAAAGGFPNGRELASCPIIPAMETAWTALVANLVERYDGDGRSDMWGLTGTIHLDLQVENESANWEFWDYGENDRTLAADRYLRLLELAYAAKASADPANTQVILTGLVKPHLLARCDGDPGCDPDTQQKLVFTKRILGRPDLFDAVDVHFFVYYHFDPAAIDEGALWVIGQMVLRGYLRPAYCLEWTGSSMLLVADGYTEEFGGYFPYAADFPSVDGFWAMYQALDDPANVTYRQWFEAEQAKEFVKVFTNLLALGARRLVHVQYSDFRDGGAWDNALWNWQGLVKYVDGVAIRKPSYYTYNTVSGRVSGFTGVQRVDQGPDVRLYKFTFATKQPVFVLWTDGVAGVLDLSSVVTRPSVRVTHVVTQLDGANAAVLEPDATVPATAVPAGDVPVIFEGVQ